MAEESKLVEEVIETTEKTEVTQKKDEFNPLAFAGDDIYGTEETKKEDKEEVSGEVENKEEESEEAKEDGWAWDSKKEDTNSEKEGFYTPNMTQYPTDPNS